MKLTAIQKQFESKALLRGDVFLLSASDTIDLIDACEKKSVQVYGTEGFQLVGDQVQPCQEHSLVLTGPPAENYIALRQFIASRMNEDIWFETTMSDS